MIAEGSEFGFTQLRRQSCKPQDSSFEGVQWLHRQVAASASFFGRWSRTSVSRARSWWTPSLSVPSPWYAWAETVPGSPAWSGGRSRGLSTQPDCSCRGRSGHCCWFWTACTIPRSRQSLWRVLTRERWGQPWYLDHAQSSELFHPTASGLGSWEKYRTYHRTFMGQILEHNKH